MSKYRKQHMSVEWKTMVGEETYEPAIRASLKDKAFLIGRAGLMMLSFGTGAWRVRACMNRMARALQVVCVADIGLLSIDIPVWKTEKPVQMLFL